MSEHEPLLQSQALPEATEATASGDSKPSQSQIRSVYVYMALMLIATVGQAMTLQAGTDAEYLTICRYADISPEHCFTDPLANDLEATLVSYTDVIGGLTSIFSLLFISQFVNVFGMKPVVLFCTMLGGLNALFYWFLLEGPKVHYLWAVVPSVLSTNTFYSMAQFLSSIYVSETITDSTYRTMFLGWMEAVISGTEILGPALGASLLGLVKTSTLYFISGLFNLAGAILIVLYMAESHKSTDEPPSILATIKLMGCFHISDPKRRSVVRRIIAFTVLSSVVGNVYTFMQYIYVKGRFGWSAVENGWLSSTGQTISLVSVAVLSPVALVKLSQWYKRSNTEIDRVDCIMSYAHCIFILLFALLKAIFPRPKAFFAFQLMSKFNSVTQPSLLNLAMKVAPPNAISSFWVGIVYLVQASMIPAVLVGVNLYRHWMKRFPESLFYGVGAGCVAMLSILVSIPIEDSQ